jgi:hypothetical protein
MRPAPNANTTPPDANVTKRLEGFDAYMAKVLKDWNGPGIGVGIVVGDTLVFAKGYGYRDYGKKLPFTPGTVCPIASNTKLFTAVAAGLLAPGAFAEANLKAKPTFYADDPIWTSPRPLRNRSRVCEPGPQGRLPARRRRRDVFAAGPVDAGARAARRAHGRALQSRVQGAVR